jgi:hypothetical protein
VGRLTGEVGADGVEEPAAMVMIGMENTVFCSRVRLLVFLCSDVRVCDVRVPS